MQRIYPVISSCHCCCSVAKLCLTLCDLMECSTPGFLVLHYLLEFAQTHVHWVDDTIQLSHSPSSPSPALNLSQLQDLSQRVSASTSASVLLMNIQGWFPLGLTGLISLQSKGFSRIFSRTTIWKHQFFGSQPSSRSNSHIRTWLMEKPQPCGYHSHLKDRNPAASLLSENICSSGWVNHSDFKYLELTGMTPL